MIAPRLYLLDVEGTVAPIAFVYQRLFPYARKHLQAFLQEHADHAAVQSDLALLEEENRAEPDAGVPRIPSLSDKDSPARGPERSGTPWSKVNGPAFQDAALAYLLWLMDRDRKSTALKSLQGKIWKAGFESGEIKGELFADVPAAFERWSKRARVAIYSSGSVEAQRLLFRYSIYGDLTAYLSAYFDTRAGAKTEGASYAAIAAAMEVAPAEAIFFSDVVRELDAAREAGFETRLVVREGNAEVEDGHGHWSVRGFDGI